MNVKKQIALAGVTIILAVVAIGYFKVSKENNRKQESIWFVKNLHYNFCGRVLKTEPLPQRWGYGYIVCKLENSNKLNTAVEDSLAHHVKHHRQLEFIAGQNDREIKFLIQGAATLSNADKVCVNSNDDSIVVYKDDKIISTQHMTLCLKNEKFNY